MDKTLDLFADDSTVDKQPVATVIPPPPPPPRFDVAPSDGNAPLAPYLEAAYLAYAMSVVKSRALPNIEDGQKPVQKRILYAMRELGNRHDQPFKKSARIVGDTIGKYHPHGDVSVYDAAVRMTQDFRLRYPLIEGQGNFGSRDGDGAAAMRYTEVRLSRFAEDILLAELDRGVIEYRDNYDGSFKEPALLPARLPVLLLNGASGIAVGMATSIPSHNIREISAACIAVINGKVDKQLGEAPAEDADDEILNLVPAPDFPGGGQIISSAEEIRRAYATGRGAVRVRARWSAEKLARGQYRIAITELPPDTSTAQVLSEIEELTNPKVKAGKKTLTIEQSNNKAAVLAVLDSMRDDSDKAHPVRIILEPKSSRVTPDELMGVLLAKTSLEENFAINLVMIGLDGKPQQKSLPQIVREWVDYRMGAVARRLAHRLGEVERRLHILDGRMIAFLNIDKVIKVIREADDPKASLIKAFGLSEMQAEDILEIRLRQLARLEGIKIESELKELREERDKLQKLLASEPARRALLVSEIVEDTKKYGDDRRTLVQEAEKVTASKVETAVDEAATVVMSRNGFLRLRTGHGVDRAALAWKEGDGEMAVLETRTVWPLILFADNGRVFSLRPSELPSGKGDGMPVASFIDLAGAKIVGILTGAPDSKVVIATSGGYGFTCRLDDMVTRQRAGKQFVTVETGEAMLKPFLAPAAVMELAALSGEGRLLVLPCDEVKALAGGGKGVVIMGLHDGEKLLDLCPIGGKLVVLGTGRGDRVSTFPIGEKDLDYYRGHRARTGRVLQANFRSVRQFDA